MRTKLSTRLSVLLAAGGLAAACGDNNKAGDNGDGIDAAPVDGGEDEGPVVTGTLAVTDVRVTTPLPPAFGTIVGGAISLSFSDVSENGGEVVFTSGAGAPINGCVVTRFDATHLPNPLLDAGTITIADASEGSGLLKTVGPCNFNEDANQYFCVSHTGSDQSVVAADLPNTKELPPGLTSYLFGEQNVPDDDKLVTSWLQVGDFANNAFDTGDTPHPIVNQGAPTLNLITFNPNIFGLNSMGMEQATETITNGSFVVINGLAPVPGTADRNFLGGEIAELDFCPDNACTADETTASCAADCTGMCGNETCDAGETAANCSADCLTTCGDDVCNDQVPVGQQAESLANCPQDCPPVASRIRITKPATDVWPAINFETYARGEGFALATASDQPHLFPTDAARDLNFTCAGAGGNCGADQLTTGELQATLISGRATKKSLAGLLPFQMPTEVPGEDEWLEFQCAWLFDAVPQAGGGAPLTDTATLLSGAVAEILEFEPTRVEVRVLRAAGGLEGQAPSQVRLLVGHGVVGHTTFPAPPAAN